MSVYEVGHLSERFDLVLFMGVLYHLRHPLLALDLLYEHVVGDMLVFQSMQRGPDLVEAVAPDAPFEEQAQFERAAYPSLYFIEERYAGDRSEEHTSELQSLMRISYAVFCLKKKNKKNKSKKNEQQDTYKKS